MKNNYLNYKEAACDWTGKCNATLFNNRLLKEIVDIFWRYFSAGVSCTGQESGLYDFLKRTLPNLTLYDCILQQLFRVV